MVIGLSLFLIGCSEEYSAVYQNAAAESKWDESQRIVIKNVKQLPPLFKVVENKIYLMIQMTESDGLFRSVVRYPSWDRIEMNRFLEKHAEIKSLIPLDWNDWLPKGYGDECKGKSLGSAQ